MMTGPGAIPAPQGSTTRPIFTGRITTAKRSRGLEAADLAGLTRDWARAVRENRAPPQPRAADVALVYRLLFDLMETSGREAVQLYLMSGISFAIIAVIGTLVAAEICFRVWYRAPSWAGLFRRP